MLKGAAIAVIVVLASATGALADVQTECDSEDGSPDQAIIACSQVIKVDSRAAWAYFKRGNAWRRCPTPMHVQSCAGTTASANASGHMRCGISCFARSATATDRP
jgi:hypothetical protein